MTNPSLESQDAALEFLLNRLSDMYPTFDDDDSDAGICYCDFCEAERARQQPQRTSNISPQQLAKRQKRLANYQKSLKVAS